MKNTIQKNDYYYFNFVSDIGMIYLGAALQGLRFIALDNPAKFLQFVSNAQKSEKPFKKIIYDIKNYLKGLSRLNADYNLDLNNYTSFQLNVWRILKTIPYGEVHSYSWVAEKTGNSNAVRAVGQANHSNPFPLIIPCHRVIAKDGSLGGFSAGIKYKQMLLEIENRYKGYYVG